MCFNRLVGTRPVPGPLSEIDKLEIELLRKKTPEEKFRMVFERIDAMRQLRKATEHLRPEAKNEST